MTGVGDWRGGRRLDSTGAPLAVLASEKGGGGGVKGQGRCKVGAEMVEEEQFVVTRSPKRDPSCINVLLYHHGHTPRC